MQSHCFLHIVDFYDQAVCNLRYVEPTYNNIMWAFTLNFEILLVLIEFST